MAYDYSQSFRLDSSVVKGATQVDIHSIDLFFKCKPTIGSPAQPNRSAIYAPGVEVAICPTAIDGTPLLSEALDYARLEYNEIPISGDGSSAATFRFPNDIYIETDKEYAIVIQPDGQEDFTLWTNKKGDFIVGTSTISAGATDKFVGNLYTSQNRITPSSNAFSQGSGGQTQGGPAAPNPAQWIPNTNEDLKFRVYVCNYGSGTGSGTGGGGNTINYTVSSTHEYILFDRKLSKKEKKAKKGEYIYQNTSFHTGSVNVQPGNLTITGTGVDFEALFPQSANNENYIVIISENDDVGHGSGNPDKINIRRIESIESNNTIIVDRLPTISNSSAKFLLPTPVGRVQIMDRSRSFDKRGNSPSWYFSDRNKQDFLIIEESNSNSSVRFVNNSIETITINNGGSGYNNTDYIVVSSSTTGSLNAVANVTTNSSGGITATYITNCGSGMIAQPTFSIKAANGASSNGSSANLSFTEGPTLRTEYEKFILRDIEVINWDIHAVAPVLNLNKPSGTKHKVTVHHGYYKDSANVYNVLQYSNANKKLVKNLRKNNFEFANTPVLMSRSNEYALANSMSYVLANGVTVNTTVSTLVEINSETDNDFIAKCVKNPGVVYYNYIINNDYTGENTPFGNALAKHISSTITMENGKQAEDILVYLRAYRPVGTDVKVFARVHNSKDPEAFDDKDWTLLDCIEGVDKFSSPTDKKDTFEYTFNFPAAPNTSFTAAGTITTESANATIVGTNTDFTSQVGGFASGDLVKIYPALFPENYQISVVNSVTNSTALVLTDKVTNTSLVGSGLLIDKLAFKNQAFNNIQTDNVARYYNTSMQGFDRFSTFAIKIVMLAENPSLYPEIEDIKAIAVSA